MPGCDECQHHGVMDGTDVGPYGKETHTTNIWAAPSNVQCKVNGKLVGPGVYNITLPGANTLPDYARTWNRLGDKMNANPIMVRLAWHDSGTYDKEVRSAPTAARGGAPPGAANTPHPH